MKPDNVAPMLLPGDLPGSYDYTGFRVPCCVVSAWSKKDYVSHQTFDHTSILKLVETKWNLPALTFRDANARNMLDFFDLEAAQPPFAEPPTLAAPRNPFSSPAALPPGSLSAADLAMFHPICTELPGGSLPPASARIASIPPHAVACMAAQEKRIQRGDRRAGPGDSRRRDQEDGQAPAVTVMYTWEGCPTVCTVRWVAPGCEVMRPPLTAAHHPLG